MKRRIRKRNDSVVSAADLKTIAVNGGKNIYVYLLCMLPQHTRARSGLNGFHVYFSLYSENALFCIIPMLSPALHAARCVLCTHDSVSKVATFRLQIQVLLPANVTCAVSGKQRLLLRYDDCSDSAYSFDFFEKVHRSWLSAVVIKNTSRHS